MPIIYEPRGKAREYSDLAVNLYTGCSHACRYCYCPAILRKTVDAWALDPQPRRDILRELERDAKKLRGDPREILLSFMSDPYHSDSAARLTRQALEVLEQYDLRVQVLTKGGRRSTQDFDILLRNRWKYGTTIIFRSEALRAEWEPGAPPIAQRIEAIRQAHAMGIFTWVSVEPVVDPAEAIRVIETLCDEVDFWKIGKLNHDREREARIDWRRFLVDAEAALVGRHYLVKKDLERFRGLEGQPHGP
jgi:DNA repair photolyase